MRLFVEKSLNAQLFEFPHVGDRGPRKNVLSESRVHSALQNRLL